MAILSEKYNEKLIEVDIQSSNIKRAVYNTENSVLTVTFNNGSIYEYEGVSWTLFTKFRMSDSQGRFFNLEIAKKHKYKKVS